MAFFMKKDENSTSNVRFILQNMLIALGILVIGLIVLFISLRRYTAHGVEVQVPNINGLYCEEASSLLQQHGLQLLIIDSTYSTKVPLGTIVEQNPPALSNAKHGRTIYAVKNASTHKKVILPELHDVSYRQAENILRQLGLKVGEIRYEPSQYSDLVLAIMLEETSLECGTQLDEGTTVDLIIGQGQGTEMVTTPDLIGMKLNEARSLLLGQRLCIKSVRYDEEPTDENRDEYIIYSQSPIANTSIREGSGIDIKLSTNLEKAVTEDTQTDHDEFF